MFEIVTFYSYVLLPNLLNLLQRLPNSCHVEVTMAVSLAISEIFSVKELSDFENGLGSFKIIENGAVR